MRVGTNRAGLPSMCAASPLAPSRALAAAMVAIEGTFWCRKTPKKHKDGAVPLGPTETVAVGTSSAPL